MGLLFIGIASCWFGVAFNFIIVMLFNLITPWELYFILHGGIISIAVIFGISTITELLSFGEDKRKIFVRMVIIILFVVEILYFIIIFTNINWLGTPIAPIQVVCGPFSYIYLTTELILLLIFGSLFVRESLKADNPAVKLKGKFLAISLILFIVASLFEIYVQEIWIFIIARLVIMLSSIFFYIGFLLPKWIENLLI